MDRRGAVACTGPSFSKYIMVFGGLLNEDTPQYHEVVSQLGQ